MSIDSVVSILRASQAMIDPGPSIADLPVNQTLEGVVLAISGQNGVTIGLGSYRLKADVEGRVSVGDKVKLVVTESGPPPQFKLLSVEPQEEASPLAAEALLPLLGQDEPPRNLSALRSLLGRLDGSLKEAAALAALIKPIQLSAQPLELSAALAQLLSQSGLFLEGKLSRGDARKDVKALALQLLEKLESHPGADASTLRALRDLVRQIESQQARNVLSLCDAGQISIPVGVMVDGRESECFLQFRFEDQDSETAGGLMRVSFSLDFSSLRRLHVELILGHSKELAVEFRAESEEMAALIDRDAHGLRQSLQSAGYQVTRISVRGTANVPNEGMKYGDAELSPPRPVLINERA